MRLTRNGYLLHCNSLLPCPSLAVIASPDPLASRLPSLGELQPARQTLTNRRAASRCSPASSIPTATDGSTSLHSMPVCILSLCPFFNQTLFNTPSPDPATSLRLCTRIYGLTITTFAGADRACSAQISSGRSCLCTVHIQQRLRAHLARPPTWPHRPLSSPSRSDRRRLRPRFCEEFRCQR